MNIISLFDGIGGFPLAFQRAGARTVVGVEIDPKPVRITMARQRDGLLGKYGIWRDVRDFDAAAYRGGADIVCAGWPCQGNSIAGKRKGLKDDRSSLFWQVIRVLRDSRPQWFLGENVPGLFSVNDGLDFLTVLRELDKLGYGVAWRVLDSQYFGVPQRRDRVFFVGHLGGPCPPEVLFEPESSEWHFAESGKAKEDVARESGRLAHKARNGRSKDIRDLAGPVGGGAYGAGRLSEDLPNIAQTLQAHHPRNAPDDQLVVSHALLASKSSRQDPSVETYIAAPLSAGSHDTSHAPGRRREDDTNLVVIQGANTARKTQHGLGVTVGGPSPTLDGGSRHAVAHTLRAEGFDASEDGTGRGVPLVVPETYSTLNASGAGFARSAGRGTEERFCIVSGDMIVRRLSPTECERLQGFPDAWTCLCGRGKGRALYGCKCPDGMRYHGLGNSISIPKVEWIARRIVNHSTAGLKETKE